MPDDTDGGFEKHYSDQGFWGKLADYAKSAGAGVVEKALGLYYCARDDATPTWARGVIVGALGYFIFPIDAIPDTVPVVGYADDLGVLAAAAATVAAHLKAEHIERAKETLKRWFGSG